MILVDTNVLSEPFRPQPDEGVIAWMVAQTDVGVSTVSLGELRRGALQLPAGRRRETLMARIDASVADLGGRVFTYDAAGARLYGHLHAHRRSLGRPLAVEDGMIAASGIIHGATRIATRNVADFEDLGLEIINPWDL